MTRQFLFLIILSFLLFSTCKKKDDFTPVKVTYYVQIADSNKVRISYNSDYYFDSGTRKPVTYESYGGIWVASHIAYEQEDYYIRVDYTDSLKPETNFQVKVIFNDTLTKDSTAYNTIITPIELSGTVTN